MASQTDNQIIPLLSPFEVWSDNSLSDNLVYNHHLDYLNQMIEEDDNLHTENDFDERNGPPEIRETIESSLTTITAANSSKAIQAEKIFFTDLLPDFPNTSDLGIAYVINVSKWAADEIKMFGSNVMYSQKQVGSIDRKSTSSFLDDTTISRTNYQCTGVMHCEYLDEEIVSMSHTEVTASMLKAIRDVRIRNQSENQDANSFFVAESQKFTKGTACIQPEPSCQPRVQQEWRGSITGVPRYIIQCSNHINRTRLHYSRPVPIRFRYQIDFLKDRFNTEDNFTQNDTCHIVEYRGTRKTVCGVDHHQGQGEIKKMDCNVKFIRLIPHNLVNYPYVIWVSIGKHTHPPPAINKTPKDIQRALFGLIQQLNDPTLTRNNFHKHPQVREFCQKYHGQTLQDVHISLANEDKIDAMIFKQRMLNYPQGQDIAAVLYRYEIYDRLSDNPYIQEVFFDGKNIMIICFLKQQIDVFIQQEWFQCDMAYKRLKNRDEREIVFAMMNKVNRKTFTLIRVIVNQDSTEMYYQMFKRVFALIKRKYNYSVRWKHLHGEGFAALVMDMDTKQLSGFGLYLQDLDPESRDWQWQIQHTIVYCTIHFKRGVERVIRQGYGHVDKGPCSPYATLLQLLFCQTAEDYNSLCEELQNPNHYPPAVIAWATHKKSEIFRCGLNKSSSYMDASIWTRIDAHTNACEQTHYKSNSYGRYLTLLRAIDIGFFLDKKDCDQLHHYLNWGAQHSYRNNSLQIQLQKTRQDYGRHHTSPTNFNSEQVSILGNATSSGDIRRSASRGRSSSRARSLASASTRRSSPSQSHLRESFNNILASSDHQQNTQEAIESKRRREEADILEREVSVKRLKLENDERELDLEERRLAILERKQRLGLI